MAGTLEGIGLTTDLITAAGLSPKQHFAEGLKGIWTFLQTIINIYLFRFEN
jgi:hypothetical protein